MREICTSGSMRGERAAPQGVAFSPTPPRYPEPKPGTTLSSTVFRERPTAQHTKSAKHKETQSFFASLRLREIPPNQSRKK